MADKFGVVIQARMGSTRLPKKMTMPFGESDTVLSFIIKRIQLAFPNQCIVLATSNSEKDQVLVEIAKDIGVEHFCGSENDVLERFIGAAEKFGITTTLRVCADNPFLSIDYLAAISAEYQVRSVDYLSYRLQDGTPVMKSHVGFFTEIISLDALKKAAECTDKAFYHEHVTNYIYGNPDKFKVLFINIPENIDQSNYRLTLDTIEDYNVLNAVEKYCRMNFTGADIYSPNLVLKAVEELNLYKQMDESIKNNPK